MLLEAYFIQVDNTHNKLATLHEYIDDTEVCGCWRAQEHRLHWHSRTWPGVPAWLVLRRLEAMI